MSTLDEYLNTLTDDSHRQRVVTVLHWVKESFPTLELRIAWNQPMFTDHGTFIIGFSCAKKHMACAPERAGMMKFNKRFDEMGLDYGKMFIRMPWTDEVPWDLLHDLIEFNIEDKKNCTTFWRKNSD